MNFEDIANEDEFNEENSSNKKSIKNSFNNNKFNNHNNEQNNIKESDNINEINNSININKDSISDKEIDKEKEEKALLEEIKALEKDKEQFFQKRKEQNDILDKYMDLLKSLQTKNEIELKNISIEDTNFEFGELIKYNSLINEIESEERIPLTARACSSLKVRALVSGVSSRKEKPPASLSRRPPGSIEEIASPTEQR